MSSPLLATLILLAVFVVGTVLPVNLGALALIAAILVGPSVLGQSVKDDKITEFEVIAEPGRLRRLDLAVLEG